jgi:hypothetical protein
MVGELLSDGALGWLRTVVGGGGDGGDLAASACALGLMAQRTPAWTEPYVDAADRLIRKRAASVDVTRGEAPAVADVLIAAGVRSMIAAGDRPTHPDLIDGLVQRCQALLAAGQPGGDGPLNTAALVRAGLGLLLHDRCYGSDHHEHVFRPWWSLARRYCFEMDRDQALPIAWFLAPQVPDDARRLYEAGIDGQAAERRAGAALALAREWGGAEGALAAAGPQPQHGLDAWQVVVECSGPGRWRRLLAGPAEPCPQVVGVDLASVALRRAGWAGGSLSLVLAPRREEPRRWTVFRVEGAEPRMWYLTGIDRATMDTAGSATVIRVPLVHGPLELTPGSY